MSQPFHIYGSSEGDQSSTRRPIVLARIPHVGAQVGAVDEFAPAGPAMPVPAVESQPSAFSQGTRYYVDSQHALAPPAELEPQRQPEPQSQPESQSHHQRRHKAHGHRRSPESSPAGIPQPGVASGLSRLHGEVTSYSALIVTLALAASGALLYWMIIVPGQAPMADYSNSYETFGSAEIVIPEFTLSTAQPDEFQFAPSTEIFAPPETTAEAAPELIFMPEQLPAPSDEAGPVFNDASAQVYPTTDYPQEWDLANLSETEFFDRGLAAFSSIPEVSESGVPPTPIHVSRQQ